MRQIRSFLHQLTDQLNYALKDVESSVERVRTIVVEESGKSEEEKAASTFNSIKSLIIKSADIIESYTDEISYRLDGSFLAVSEFGNYQESTSAILEANSQNIDILFSNSQAVESKVESIDSAVRDVTAGVIVGNLYEGEDGIPMYGIELRQEVKENGGVTYRKFARFTSEKLSFFDQNGEEVAYISGRKLHILTAEIDYSLSIGGFVMTVQSDGSVVKKWRGYN
jgi:hypothetical protein